MTKKDAIKNGAIMIHYGNGGKVLYKEKGFSDKDWKEVNGECDFNFDYFDYDYGDMIK